MSETEEERSGCLVALYALFAVGAFAVFAAVVALLVFLRSEQGQQVTRAIGKGVDLLSEATQAAGTEELTDAGCETAMVTTFGESIGVFSAFVPDGTLEEIDSQGCGEVTLVACFSQRFLGEPPTCDLIARTYGSAVAQPPDEFAVIVYNRNSDEMSCDGVFDPKGHYLAELSGWCSSEEQ